MIEKKVHFNLEIDEDGFPPISVETINGYVEDGNLVRLDNTPFFVKCVALGDVVECAGNASGRPFQFLRVHRRSNNRAISILFIDLSCKEEVYQSLKKFGCYCEYGKFGALEMLAVCVEKSIDYDQVAAYLNVKEDQMWLSYAELCV